MITFHNRILGGTNTHLKLHKTRSKQDLLFLSISQKQHVSLTGFFKHLTENRAYLDFHKARKNSFAATRVNQNKLVDMLKTTAKEAVGKLKKDTLDVLIYLAKETVAQLVDLALLVRQDAMAEAGDLRSRVVNPLPTSSTDIFGRDQNQIEGPSAITPDEIREVMRRYWSTLLCPFGSLTFNTYCPFYHQLLVCS